MICFHLHFFTSCHWANVPPNTYFPSYFSPAFIVRLCEYEASYRTAHRTVEEPRLFSCIFKQACTHTQRDTHSHTVKGSLALGQGISTKDWSWTRVLIGSQAGQLQSGAREAPPCLPRSKASFSKALFAFCSVRQLNSTQKSLFLAFLCPLFFRFSLSLTRLLSDSWFNSCVLKEIMCLIGLLGVFFKWVLTHPHSPSPNSPLGRAVRYMFPDSTVCRMQSMKWKPVSVLQFINILYLSKYDISHEDCLYCFDYGTVLNNHV